MFSFLKWYTIGSLVMQVILVIGKDGEHTVDYNGINKLLYIAKTLPIWIFIYMLLDK